MIHEEDSRQWNYPGYTVPGPVLVRPMTTSCLSVSVPAGSKVWQNTPSVCIYIYVMDWLKGQRVRVHIMVWIEGIWHLSLSGLDYFSWILQPCCVEMWPFDDVGLLWWGHTGSAGVSSTAAPDPQRLISMDDGCWRWTAQGQDRGIILDQDRNRKQPLAVSC